MKIKKGDKVRIMVGDNSIKGKEGIVTKVLRKENKVIVEGLNLVIKHQKPNQNILMAQESKKKHQLMLQML